MSVCHRKGRIEVVRKLLCCDGSGELGNGLSRHSARAASGEIVSRGERQTLEASRRGVGCQAREKASVAVP